MAKARAIQPTGTTSMQETDVNTTKPTTEQQAPPWSVQRGTPPPRVQKIGWGPSSRDIANMQPGEFIAMDATEAKSHRCGLITLRKRVQAANEIAAGERLPRHYTAYLAEGGKLVIEARPGAKGGGR